MYVEQPIERRVAGSRESPANFLICDEEISAFLLEGETTCISVRTRSVSPLLILQGI